MTCASYLYWSAGPLIVLLIVFNVVQSVVVTRRLHRVMALDRLLSRLCLEVCQNQHLPVWRAWAGTMGDITIEVTGKRYHWSSTSRKGNDHASET